MGMPNAGIVLISHSPKVVDGIKDIIVQMVPDARVATAGGTEDNAIGTSAGKIAQAIEEVYNRNGVLLFYDIGSALMNAEAAVELCDHDNVIIVDAPILEGSFVAAVESGMGKTLQEIKAAVEKIGQQ